MKTIVVGTDFSVSSDNAATYAADMAVSLKADLFLFHVFQMPVSYSEIPMAVNVDEIMQQAQEEVDKLKVELLNRSSEPLNVTTSVFMGTFFEELKGIVERLNPYAVIIGTQGKTSTERFFFGSEAVYTLKNLHVPVIAVPPSARFNSIKNIGLACDFEDVAETTPIEAIKTLIADFKSELHILNTGSQQNYSTDLSTQSGLMLALLADLKPHYHFIGNADIDEGTLNFAYEKNIDLLIVLPKKHSFIEKLIHKSHTKEFALHSHVPVMALHKD
jgi:nucleotide-binding universal stress UspA family protein